ncbi:protein of unknown function [Rhodovastum atsumiense]|nr:protein of unknown function [Rhodovastum atsumiense]
MVMERQRSRPQARGVTAAPGGAWQRRKPARVAGRRLRGEAILSVWDMAGSYDLAAARATRGAPTRSRSPRRMRG